MPSWRVYPTYYGLYAAFLASHAGRPVRLQPPIGHRTGGRGFPDDGRLSSPLATAGSQGYIAYAILLALMVGVFQLLLGILRLGLVVNFLSHPVVNGFTNAAALIIATSQLDKMFGASVDTAEHHYETILRVIQAAAHYTHWPTLIMGAAAFAIMFGLKKISPKVPNVLVAVAITTVISWSFGFQHDDQVNLFAD